MKEPRPTDDLNNVEAWPFEDGVNEVAVRISRYEADGKTPAAFQAIAKHRDRKKVWGVGIAGNPVAAVTKCIAAFYENQDRPWPDGKPHGFSRTPLYTGATGSEADGAEKLNAQLAAEDAPEADVDDLLDMDVDDLLS